MVKEAATFCRFVRLADTAYSNINGEQLPVRFFIVFIFKIIKKHRIHCANFQDNG